MIKDNESICSECSEKTDDDTNTIFDNDGNPYCKDCYLNIHGKDEIYIRWKIGD